MSDIFGDDHLSVRETEGGILPRALSRFAGAAVFLVLVLGMAGWAYRLGTRDATEVPIVRALEGSARVQPEDPGGLRAAHQGLEVNDVLADVPPDAPADAPADEPGSASGGDAPTLVPPAVTLAEEDGPQGELVVAAPAFTAVEPAEGEELRMPPQDDGPPAGDPLPAEAEAAVAPAVPDIGSLVAGLIAAAETGPALPAPRPMVRPSGLPVPRAAPPPAADEAAPPAAPPPAAAAREVSSIETGARLVQLGAFDNEALARQVWSQLVGRHGDLLGAKSLYLERATHNARVFYRLRVAGFQSTDQTRVLCESLRARGVDCIPVTLQ